MSESFMAVEQAVWMYYTADKTYSYYWLFRINHKSCFFISRPSQRRLNTSWIRLSYQTIQWYPHTLKNSQSSPKHFNICYLENVIDQLQLKTKFIVSHEFNLGYIFQLKEWKAFCVLVRRRMKISFVTL